MAGVSSALCQAGQHPAVTERGGLMSPTIHVSHTLPLERAAEALNLVRGRKAIGKAVLV